MKKTSLTLAVIGMIGFNNAIAHDVWLEHKQDSFELVYGHVGELETFPNATFPTTSTHLTL